MHSGEGQPAIQSPALGTIQPVSCCRQPSCAGTGCPSLVLTLVAPVPGGTACASEDTEYFVMCLCVTGKRSLPHRLRPEVCGYESPHASFFFLIAIICLALTRGQEQGLALSSLRRFILVLMLYKKNPKPPQPLAWCPGCASCARVIFLAGVISLPPVGLLL